MILAVIGAIGGGSLANRFGLKRLLWLALLINALSQLALASAFLLPKMSAFIVVLVGTAALGFSFGLGGAPLNSYPPIFFPKHKDTALVALHTIPGLGLAVGPLVASALIGSNMWIAFPVMLLGISFGLAFITMAVSFPQCESGKDNSQQRDADIQRPNKAFSFWIFLIIAVLYAFAEGTFSSWAVIYLQEAKHLAQNIAGPALSIFWIAMVVGRLLTSIAVLRVPPERIWLALPALMISAFLLLPYANTPLLGISLFALAGLACSGFFPLSIGLISKRFAHHVPYVSSMMIAALMIGVGVGSFIIGALRKNLELEQLYQLSAFYPIVVLILTAFILWQRKPRSTLLKPQSLAN